MSDPVDVHTFVSPGLHQKNVEAIEGYEAHKLYLAGVLESFSTAYEGMASIHKARLAAAKNPTMNDAGRLLIVAGHAEKTQNAIARKFDKTKDALDKGIAGLESDLNQPLKAAAGGGGSIPEEIRQHVKGLSTKDRQKFLNDAQEAGDVQTLSAVLGAPNYLSGIGEAEKTARTRQYHEAKSPDITARLSAMKAGRELLMERSALLIPETEKGLGHSWVDVKEVRDATSASDSYAITGVK